MPKAFIIAAPFSGSGKTFLAGALLALLRERGFRVAPFKIGPDYLDPGHLSSAAGRPCYNLDSWMLSPEALSNTLARGLWQAEIGVVEGVMGLFDGIKDTPRASTAEVAKILKLPVLLIFPAQGLSSTLAPLVKGVFDFAKEIRLLGVVLTKTGGPEHQKILTRVLEREGIRVFGALPRRKEFALPSRHLGLVQAEEIGEAFWEKVSSWLSSHFDLEALLEALPETTLKPFNPLKAPPRAVIAVARDEAFSFYYQENLDLLKEAGAELVFFSPLRDPLPEAQGYYFGGGYPELWAFSLSQRADLFSSLREKYRAGFPVWAECGGFMFLTQAILKDGVRHPMAGLIEAEVEFSGRLEALGYRELTALSENFLLAKGERARGHEFRYGRLCQPLAKGFMIKDASGEPRKSFGLVEENLFASYVHLHLGSHPEMASRFVDYAAQKGL